ncbi:MAG: hypothetical protein U0805_08690 [Pirellulales bacterium]
MQEHTLLTRSPIGVSLVIAITAALLLIGLYLLASARFKKKDKSRPPFTALKYTLGFLLAILGAFGTYKLAYSAAFYRVAFDDQSVTLFPQSWRPPTTLPWAEITAIEVQRYYVKPHMQNRITIDTKSAGRFTSIGLAEAQSPNPIKEVAAALQKQWTATKH